MYGYVADPNTWIDPFGLLTEEQAAGLKNIDLGNWGERVISQFLKKNGFNILGSIQNASNHGFDLVVINNQTGRLTIIEVKTSRAGWGNKANMQTWVQKTWNTIMRNTNGHWKNIPAYQQKLIDMIGDALKDGTLDYKLARLNLSKRSIEIRCK